MGQRGKKREKKRRKMVTEEKVEAIAIRKESEVIKKEGRKNEIRMWEEGRQKGKGKKKRSVLKKPR